MKERADERLPETENDTQQRRMTDRGTDRGTSEPGMPPRTGRSGTSRIDERLEGGPTEDSPAREPTERVEPRGAP